MREGKVLHGHGPVHDVTDVEVEAAAEYLRSNIGMLRVQNHRVWLYGPDGCEEERHEH